MDECALLRLPDELLESIVVLLPPDCTLAFGTTCQRIHKIANEHLLWRRHCTQTWRYWEASHELTTKLQQPPGETKWRALYNERRRIDSKASRDFDELLTTQRLRIQRIEEVSKAGYDVKDLLLRLRDQTPDDAEDVLARRYYAGVILARIHRVTALEKWERLHKQQMVSLEEVLGAYDLFVLGGRRGDLKDMNDEFDRIAAAIRAHDPEFDDLSTRKKAVQIAQWLRAQNLVGNPTQDDYHALRNNFISLALFEEPHSSLPLQSVAIYCAVARRLGINASPSNYPGHVHAVIKASPNQTLDGRPTPTLSNEDGEDAEPELMHMDPWRNDEETPRDHLTLRLSQMGAPQRDHHTHLAAAATLEITLRTGRNIMTSVQEARDRPRNTHTGPDIDAAWYSMLWSMMILSEPNNAAASLHRRRQCLPYMAEHFQTHFPEDLDLVEKLITPMFPGEREQGILMHIAIQNRTADRNMKAPKVRITKGNWNKNNDPVEQKVGQHFRHKRYGYTGIITGWDFKCTAEARWMHQMRVDDLPRGREQPFYHICADDKSQRYVAEENIEILEEKPNDYLMNLAGRWFKRWDDDEKAFVSNIRDEYPED